MQSGPPSELIDAVAALKKDLQPKSNIDDLVARSVSIEFVFVGNDAAVTVGSHVYLVVDFPCRLSGWAIVADVVGSIEFDVKGCLLSAFPTSTSLVAGAPPTLSTARFSSGDVTAVSTWSQTIPRASVLEAIVTSISDNIEVCTLSLRAKRLDW